MGVTRNMLTPDQFRDRYLKGVWAAIPLPWTEQGTVDESLLRHLVAVYKAAGVHGVYTTGTDGEFHVLDFPEFRALVDVFSRIVEEIDLPAQVGTTWLHTAGVLERTAYARDKGINAVQIALPFWQALNDREVTTFFGQLAQAFPDIAIIHYNIASAKRFLSGADYERLVDVAPNLVGTKQTGGNVAALEEVIIATPTIHHFVVDPHVVPGILLGAKGTYSAIVNISSTWMMKWWADCERGDWTSATRRKVVVDRMDRDAQLLLPHLTAEPSWAKLYARCGVAPQISLTVRAPYLGASETDAKAFRQLLEERYPELVE